MRSGAQLVAVVIVCGLTQWGSAHSMVSAPDRAPAHDADAEVLQAQDQLPVFRGGVELIQLDVSVLDRNRWPITGLNAPDFTILENGVERPIRAFDAITLPSRSHPVVSVSHATVPPDVATNWVGGADGRLVIILMDRTIPPGQPTLAAKNVALAAVEALGPNDLAALVSTSGGVPQNLTSDRARLTAAITQRDWSTGLSPEQEAVVGKQDALTDGRCLCGLCVLETVTRVAEAVQHTPRRHKMLLFVGSRLIVQAGPRAPLTDMGCSRRVEDARRAMVDALALSNLTVHSIDPGGLRGPNMQAGAPGGRPDQDGPAARRQALQAETANRLSDQGSLQILPDLTGGRAVVNANTPDGKVPEIFAESASYYVLAFEPHRSSRSGGERSLEVRVKRSGARVHAQRRYALPPAAVASGGAEHAGVQPSLERAIRGLLPDASRPLTLAIAAFAGPESAKALVLANVDVARFADDWDSPLPLEVAVSAIDRTGREIASARQVSTVTASAASGVAADVNIQTHLEVPAGDYEVRVAVLDPAHGRVASVFGQIAIPLFGTAALSLSDILVEATRRPASMVAAGQRPTTRRVFHLDEDVRALLQVYQGTERRHPVLPVSVRMSIVDVEGRTVRNQVRSLTAADFTDRRASVAMELGQLQPGEYTLTIEAAVDGHTPRRVLPFAVR